MAAEHPAVAFHTSLPEGQAAGVLLLTSEAIHFASVSASQDASLSGLQVQLGGFNGKQVILTHSDWPDWRIVVGNETAFLQEEALRHHPQLAEKAQKSIRHRRQLPWPLKLAIALIAAFVALLLYGLWQLDDLARLAADKVPISTEENFGNAIAAQFQSQLKVINEAALQAKLDSAAGRLRSAQNSSGYQFRFHIVDDPSLNAFAVPGGHIFVHRGLLETANRPEEVAGVLAHEMAHVTQRHSLRNFLKSAGLGITLSILLGGDLSSDAALNVSRWLVEQKFSRDFEREADEVGFGTLLSAKVDPAGLLEFFQKMKAQESRAAGVPPDWLSTHPATQERMEHLKSLQSTIPADFRAEPILALEAARGAVLQ